MSLAGISVTVTVQFSQIRAHFVQPGSPATTVTPGTGSPQ
ncbi:hypothetical protein ART_4198 [Arthrobacter sp. PAMC 25486]|nr:hypothetical protein ART_4198 [Arthrobacter sp. PAMC 25486]